MKTLCHRLCRMASPFAILWALPACQNVSMHCDVTGTYEFLAPMNGGGALSVYSDGEYQFVWSFAADIVESDGSIAGRNDLEIGVWTLDGCVVSFECRESRAGNRLDLAMLRGTFIFKNGALEPFAGTSWLRFKRTGNTLSRRADSD